MLLKNIKWILSAIQCESKMSSFSGTVLEQEKKECKGKEESKGKLDSVQECADACFGVSSMFIFGTNDYGTARCEGNGKQCQCFCETSATDDGSCDITDHNGYRLYKYIPPGKFLS